MESETKNSKEAVWDLFWLSALSLFLELLAIRWLASEVRALSFFKNFPLIASYVGLGYGFMKETSNGKLFKCFPFCLLALVLAMVSTPWTGLADVFMPSLRVGGGILLGWEDATHPVQYAAQHPVIYIFLSLFAIFGLSGLVATMMAGIGQKIGSLFHKDAPLRSYLVNLFGSVVGIAAFSVLAFLWTGPAIWLAVGTLMAVYPLRRYKLGLGVMILTVALVAVIPPVTAPRADIGTKVLWSPYHRVEISPMKLFDTNNQVGYQISVNKGFFQQCLDLSDEFFAKQPAKYHQQLEDFRLDQYELPYYFVKAKRVLIMGAGTGNDVAAALRNGAEHIDAVEIDPMTVDLGKKLHPTHPYASPKVTVYVNDARAFLRQNHDKYDVCITAFLDSHAVAGNSLSVRLDDYVYTVEGMEDALAHVAPGGLYCNTYCATTQDLSHRLIANLRKASPVKPMLFQKDKSFVLHLYAPPTKESWEKLAELKKLGFIDKSSEDDGGIRNSTDDWPFLYMASEKFDYFYFGIMACILLLSWVVCGPSIRKNYTIPRWKLFFLGAAFLLMELGIIDRLSLVFGTTWIVNSVCIFAVLLAVILSNILIMKRPSIMPANAMYAGLFITLVLLYVIPIKSFNAMGMWVGGSLSALLSAIPVFFAGMIFSSEFKNEKSPNIGLAFNMLGSVIGGLLEYVSTYSGIKSLLICAGVFYLLSMVASNAAGKGSGESS